MFPFVEVVCEQESVCDTLLTLDIPKSPHVTFVFILSLYLKCLRRCGCHADGVQLTFFHVPSYQNVSPIKVPLLHLAPTHSPLRRLPQGPVLDSRLDEVILCVH